MSIRLNNVVVTRKVPMTESTCTSLRLIRDKYQEQIKQQLGSEEELSFPVVLDLLVKDYMEKVYESSITSVQEG